MMKSKALLLMTAALALALAAPLPALADDPPAFSLETAPDDSPETAVKKAALRLLKAYSVTMMHCKSCASEAGMDKAAAGYSSRNGNTMAQVMGAIKRLGGLDKTAKDMVDKDIADAHQAALEGQSCADFLEALKAGRHDLYKAPELAKDYQTVKSGKSE